MEFVATAGVGVVIVVGVGAGVDVGGGAGGSLVVAVSLNVPPEHPASAIDATMAYASFPFMVFPLE